MTILLWFLGTYGKNMIRVLVIREAFQRTVHRQIYHNIIYDVPIV